MVNTFQLKYTIANDTITIVKKQCLLLRAERTNQMSVMSVIALQKNVGWSHVQLDDITKMQKSWRYDNKEYRVDVYFGRLRDGRCTPVVIMNVYEQGAGAKQVIDDNCDVWKNLFTSTTKDEGNDYFLYLKKHGFQKVK